MTKEEMGAQALYLWRKWFEEDEGMPWEYLNPGDRTCFFCVADYPDHKPDCVFTAAKRLVARTKIENGT